MPSNNIYLEVLKGSGAILSYFLELPTTQSIAVNYVEATREELTYLSALVDHILPAGTVVTLAHLEAHRSRVREAKAVKAARHIAAAPRPLRSLPRALQRPPTKTRKIKHVHLKPDSSR